MKAEVDSIVETRMAKLMDSLQSNIIQAVESTFEDALQLSYFSSNKGIKTEMLNVIEHILTEVVRSGRAPTVRKAKIRGLLKTKSVAGIIVKTALSSTNFSVPAAKIVCNLIAIAIDEHHLR